MLAAPRSPLRTPASCAASLRARYSPPRLTCCRRSALPGSPLAVLQPPPHLCGKVAVLHPRLTRRLPTPRTPRRSPHSRPHAPLQQAGRARAGSSSRQSTQERCKAGRQQGRGTPVNQSAQRQLPAHSPLTSYPIIHNASTAVASVSSRMMRWRARTFHILRPNCKTRGRGCTDQAEGYGGNPRA